MGVTATTSTGCWPGKGTLRPGVDPSRMSGWVTSVKFTGDLDRETSMQLYAVGFLLLHFPFRRPRSSFRVAGSQAAVARRARNNATRPSRYLGLLNVPEQVIYQAVGFAVC